MGTAARRGRPPADASGETDAWLERGACPVSHSGVPGTRHDWHRAPGSGALSTYKGRWRSMIMSCVSQSLPRRTSTFVSCGGFRGSRLRRVTGRRCRAPGSASWSDVTSAYAGRFYTRLLTLYTERRTEFEASRGPARYQEGLERLQMSQRFATTGYLGQLACIAEQPGETVTRAAPD
jgi:hypothetical protein